MTSPLTLSFRRRLLLILILLGAVPTGLAVLGWALTMRASNPIAATRATIEDLGVSGRVLVETIDSTKLTRPERRALGEHARHLNEALEPGPARRGVRPLLLRRPHRRHSPAGRGGDLRLASAGGASLPAIEPADRRAGRLDPPYPAARAAAAGPAAARRPGVRGAARRPPRDGPGTAGSPGPRNRDRSGSAPSGEVARRVAHEMKNPLTPIGFAVSQLERAAREGEREAMEVIRAESDAAGAPGPGVRRLRPAARGTRRRGGPGRKCWRACSARRVPPRNARAVSRSCPERRRILGHYDPLRRAFSNLLRNAVRGGGQRASHRGPGRCARARRGAHPGDRDHGPGMPDSSAPGCSIPTSRAKDEGTGLGLALVRQTDRGPWRQDPR